jgi:hypothetical protein
VTVRGGHDTHCCVDSADFFLSHASPNKPFVRRLHRFLTRLGFDVWLDVHAIVPGDQLAFTIAKGLRQAKAVIVVLSKASLKSNWLSYEINTVMPRVIEKKCRLIPVLIENVEVPAELKSFLYADFRQSFKKGCLQLRKALEPFEREQAAKRRDYLPPLSMRETLLRAAINAVFDRSKLRHFPPVGNYTPLDFSGRADDSDRQYLDEVYLCYERSHAEQDIFEMADVLLGRVIRSAPINLDDNYMFDLSNRIAGEGGSYYHLLLADRPVSPWTRATSRTDGRVRVRQSIHHNKEAPASMLISVDVTGITDKDKIISHLQTAREIYRKDSQRWMGYANRKKAA